MKQKQKRATFEDVSQSQDILLDFLDDCIKNNKPLSEKDRKTFIKKMRYATLGLGTEYKFYYKGKKHTYDLKHVEHAAYWLAYQTKSEVTIQHETIPIRLLWLELRDMLWLVFPHAIETSVKISKEQTEYTPSEPAVV